MRSYNEVCKVCRTSKNLCVVNKTPIPTIKNVFLHHHKVLVIMNSTGHWHGCYKVVYVSPPWQLSFVYRYIVLPFVVPPSMHFALLYPVCLSVLVVCNTEVGCVATYEISYLISERYLHNLATLGPLKSPVYCITPRSPFIF